MSTQPIETYCSEIFAIDSNGIKVFIRDVISQKRITIDFAFGVVA